MKRLLLTIALSLAAFAGIVGGGVGVASQAADEAAAASVHAGPAV